VSKCKGQKTIDGEQVPLVLTPSGDGKVEALVAALKANREWVEAKVVSNSGVLLHGFDMRDAVEFNSIVEALRWPDIRYIQAARWPPSRQRAASAPKSWRRGRWPWRPWRRVGVRRASGGDRRTAARRRGTRRWCHLGGWRGGGASSTQRCDLLQRAA
jgi:hypothetical protein